MTIDPEQAIQATEAWLRTFVIDLKLCPFAAAPFRKDAIRYRVSNASKPELLLMDLLKEFSLLSNAEPSQVATTLLIIPYTLEDFKDFNDFLAVADAALAETGLEGVLQIASFHPNYQFADSPPDAVSHYTNRSPYPTLHLLREADVSRAVDGYPNVEAIPQTNIRRMEALGERRIKALLAACLKHSD